MYIDPGFGGMLLQAIVAIAAVSGALVFSMRKKIRKFIALLMNRRSNSNKTAAASKSGKKGKQPNQNHPTPNSTEDYDVIDTLSDDK